MPELEVHGFLYGLGSVSFPRRQEDGRRERRNSQDITRDKQRAHMAGQRGTSPA